MESTSIRFEPRRGPGVLAHLLLLLGLGGASLALFGQATRAALGPVFLAALLGSLALALPLPLTFYRLYGLLRSAYVIERDGIRLRWGLRAEHIPVDQVLWVELAEDLVRPLDLPAPRWPGALVGVQTHPDAGDVEFMAAGAAGLVLIGTAARTYAISPGDPEAFRRAYQTQLERGTLGPLRPYSARPAFLFAEVWQIPPARSLLLALILLNLTLFVWVGLAVPGLETISLGYTPTGRLQNPVGAGQLFLLPAVSLLLGAAGAAAALAFHRRAANHPLAYVAWCGSLVSSLLFLAAVYVILQNA
ncbi:MAG: hypothetical protein HYZ26_03425 [Chloroflexi bacterium]|nr:hypothetical protein [Chloroflexota bacterium]